MKQDKKKGKFLKEITNTFKERKLLNENKESDLLLDIEAEKGFVVSDEEIVDLRIDEDKFFTDEDFLLMQSEEIFPDLELEKSDILFINK